MRLMDSFLGEAKATGSVEVQNFPTVGLIDGVLRANLEDTRTGHGEEVKMVRLAHGLDLLTTPYVFDPGDAEQMAKAGADILVARMGLTTSGSIGAKTAKRTEACVGLTDKMARAGRKVREDMIVLCHAGPIAEPDDAGFILIEELPESGRLLRGQLDGPATDGAGRQVPDGAFCGPPALTMPSASGKIDPNTCT
jgi:predicted TIM-barrel enzyme